MRPHRGLTSNDFIFNDMKINIVFSLRIISSAEKWLESLANATLIAKCEITFLSPYLKKNGRVRQTKATYDLLNKIY